MKKGHKSPSNNHHSLLAHPFLKHKTLTSPPKTSPSSPSPLAISNNTNDSSRITTVLRCGALLQATAGFFDFLNVGSSPESYNYIVDSGPRDEIQKENRKKNECLKEDTREVNRRPRRKKILSSLKKLNCPLFKKDLATAFPDAERANENIDQTRAEKDLKFARGLEDLKKIVSKYGLDIFVPLDPTSTKLSKAEQNKKKFEKKAEKLNKICEKKEFGELFPSAKQHLKKCVAAERDFHVKRLQILSNKTANTKKSLKKLFEGRFNATSGLFHKLECEKETKSASGRRAVIGAPMSVPIVNGSTAEKEEKEEEEEGSQGAEKHPSSTSV